MNSKIKKHFIEKYQEEIKEAKGLINNLEIDMIDCFAYHTHEELPKLAADVLTQKVIIDKLEQEIKILGGN